jgi:hypothetical protein
MDICLSESGQSPEMDKARESYRSSGKRCVQKGKGKTATLTLPHHTERRADIKMLCVSGSQHCEVTL